MRARARPSKFRSLLETACSQLDLGADTIAIADLAHELNAHRAVPVASVVAGNAKAAARNAEDDVGIAIAINVSGRGVDAFQITAG